LPRAISRLLSASIPILYVGLLPVRGDSEVSHGRSSNHGVERAKPNPGERIMKGNSQVPAHQTEHSGSRTLNRALKSLNRFAPLLTILVAAISFLGGIFFNAFSAREKAAEDKVEQWRRALEKVSFDEPSLLTTAYLMDSFSAQSAYHDQARAIEAEALARTNDPHKFDLMFAIMLRHTSNDDEIDLVRMARTLSIELRGLHNKASSSSNLKFADFLMNPKQAYPTESGSYKRTLVLLWEIDSISQGFRCSWTRSSPSCTSLSPKNQNLHEVLFFNHPLPPSILDKIPESVRPESYDTCAVVGMNTTPHEPEFACQAPTVK
jgi:hypothetical protein